MCKDKKGIDKILCRYMAGDYATEVPGAISVILCGIWLFFNDTFLVSNVYKIMAQLASEKGWGTIFVSIGLFQLLVIWFDGKRFKLWKIPVNTKWIRKHILLLKGAIWLILFFGILQGDARALSTPIYLFFSLNAFRAFFCITVDT
jgi:hypothetical protein